VTLTSGPAPKTLYPELSFTLAPDPAALFAARQRVRTHLQLSPLGPLQIDDVVMALEEACTNIIRHSGSDEPMEVSLAFEGRELEVVVRDHGQGFDASLFDPGELPDLMAEGGRGLFLMSRLMDRPELETEDGCLVRMRLRGSRGAEAPAYRLADLVDVPQLQALLDSLHEAFDCPTAIIDNEARVLTATGWQDACTRFHRVNDETRAQCEESDLHIYGQLGAGSEAVSYVCPRGMIDCAAPIRIEGRHLGNVFIGQVFVDPPDLDAYRREAQRHGFDEEAYLEAVARVPVISRSELQRRLPFVRDLAEMIAELGLARLREKATNDAEPSER
jgi:anti-sigma regulatory factor (Ser/Thr protein kinase)/ligand-binding sensor protein